MIRIDGIKRIHGIQEVVSQESAAQSGMGGGERRSIQGKMLIRFCSVHYFIIIPPLKRDGQAMMYFPYYSCTVLIISIIHF